MDKILIFTSTTLLVILLLASCSSTKKVNLGDITPIKTLRISHNTSTDTVHILKVKDKYGLMTSNGEIVLDFKYANMQFLHYRNKNFFKAYLDSKRFSLYNYNNKSWICENIDSILRAEELYVKRGNNYGILSVDSGKLIAPIAYNEIIELKRNVLALKKGSQYNLLYKPQGNEHRNSNYIFINQDFDTLSLLNSYTVWASKKDTAYILRLYENKSREFANYEDITTCTSLTLIKTKGKWRAYNKTLNRVSNEFDKSLCLELSGAEILIKKYNKWGAIYEDYPDSFRIQPEYDTLIFEWYNYDPSYPVFKVIDQDGKVGIVSEKGIEIPQQYENVQYSRYKDYYWVKENGQYYLYGHENNYFDTVITIRHNIEFVKKGNYYGVYDLESKSLIQPCRFDTAYKAGELNSAFIALIQDSSLYLMDNNYKIINEESYTLDYESISPNWIIVKDFRGNYQMINYSDDGYDWKDSIKYDSVYLINPRGVIWAASKNRKHGVFFGFKEDFDLDYIKYDEIFEYVDYNYTGEVMVIVRQGDKWSWINANNALVYPFKFDKVERFFYEEKTNVVIDGEEKTLWYNGEVK